MKRVLLVLASSLLCILLIGWGVNQDEVFPKLLARKTGLTVLNTAISSYGTAREVENVLRLGLDYSNVETLINPVLS